MKKFLIAAVVGGLSVLGLATPAMATNHKVTICHWANGHPHAISISINATAGEDIGHGLLTPLTGLNTNTVADDTATFVPHNTPGHSGDSFMHFGKEIKGDDDTQSDDDKCADSAPPTPPGPPGPPGVTFYPICVPNVGIRFVTVLDAVLAEGEFYLNAQSGVCPLKGNTGNTGGPGIQGPAGEDGPAGPPGPAGPAGPQGPAGNDGAAGPTGPAGAAGPAGANGSDGAAGPTGSNGESVTPAPAAGPAPTALPRTGGGSNLTAFAALAILLGGLTTFMSRLIRKDAAQA